MTFERYAKEKSISPSKVNEMFSASGFLECDRSKISAQLVGNRFTVTTAAHIFYDDNCNQRKFGECKFRTFDGKGTPGYKIEKINVANFCCNGSRDRSQDFVVIELAEGVPPKHKPYELPNINPSEVDKITTVSAFARNFSNGGRYPRNVSECHIKSIRSDGVLITDCDTGLGSSGGAQLIPGRNGFQMVAMHVSSTQTDGQYEYNLLFSSNRSVPVSGTFLEAIKRSVERTGGPSH